MNTHKSHSDNKLSETVKCTKIHISLYTFKYCQITTKNIVIHTKTDRQ